MALSAIGRFKISNCLECHCYHVTVTNNLLLGDSMIAGLSRCLKIWQIYFTPYKASNSGTGRDRPENTLW